MPGFLSCILSCMTDVRIADAVPADVLPDYDPLVRQLLFNRGMTEAAVVDAFLNPHFEEHLHDPFLMTDMDRAVDRILRAMRDNEHIVVYSDYDCDGIPGGVLLHDFFHALGYTNFENYIPHRHEEGYGFNGEAVDMLAARNATLIITVDCGITDVASVAHAVEKGIDVIITDHHEVGDVLPDAYAILNPKRDDAYPFPHLCGSGVAFKLVQAVLARGRENGSVSLPEGMEKWWLDVVGLATVADMVPLFGENRALAHYGLAVLRKTRRPGLQQLLRRARVNARDVSEDDIGFTIGPRINAASRMDTPEDAFHMLALRDEGEAGARVRHLEKLNNERKGVVAAMVKDMKKRLAELTTIPDVVVMGNPSWRPSLVGLAANTLVETYKRPAFVWGRDGRGVIKGSCRSDGRVSVVELMRAVPDAFIEFGGHHASGGFSVPHDQVHTFATALNEAHGRLQEGIATLDQRLMVDADLNLSEVFTAYAQLKVLAPFGEGNPKPLFRFKNVTPTSVETFGKVGNHTKARFDTGGKSLEAIGFFKAPDAYTTPLAETPIDLIAHIESSVFMGRRQVRLRIIDVLPSGHIS